MAIDVQWHNPEKTILRVTFTDPWTWQDFYAMDELTEALADAVPHKVCYIVDLRHTRMVPPGISLGRVRAVLQPRHPTTDLIVAVGMVPFIRVMLNTIIHASGRLKTSLMMVDTMDKAEQIIAERQARSADSAPAG